jgi:peptidoglycan/LPS O-acetylase OafA/YrhL
VSETQVSLIDDKPTMPPKRQLLPLTGLRFFLAFWVVIYHQTSPENYLGPLMTKLPETIFCVSRTGYVAVGVFFVLSGFVLSYSHSLATRFSSSQLADFAIARFARIYPTYCFGLLLIAPFIGAQVLRNWSVTAATKETARALLNWTLLQSWIPRAALSWNAPGWSLSDEAFFYCCFPFVGVALWKLSGFRSILLTASVIWAAALIAPLIAFSAPLRPFGIAPATSAPWDANPFWANLISFNPLLRLPDFCIGVLVCRIYHELHRRNNYLLGRGYWLYIPGLLLEVLALSNSNVLLLSFVQNGLLLPLHSLIILGFALGGGACGRLLSTSPLVFLGNASYAMYILHIPLFFWMNTIAKTLFDIRPTGVGWMLCYVTVVVCVSSVLFKVLEQPANRILKLALSPRLGRPSPKHTIDEEACSSPSR